MKLDNTCKAEPIISGVDEVKELQAHKAMEKNFIVLDLGERNVKFLKKKHKVYLPTFKISPKAPTITGAGQTLFNMQYGSEGRNKGH